MRTEILIFLLLCSGCLHSQTDSLKVKRYISSSSSGVGVLYGQKIFKNDFFQQFNTLNKYSRNLPISYIGIGSTVAEDENLSYCQILPQRISIHDTISVKITGYSVSIMGGDELFGNSENANIVGNFGLNFGRTKISDNSYVNKKNAFFSPKLALIPYVKISGFIISIRGEYEFDISHYSWRSISNQINVIDLPKLNQSGLTVLIGIGYVW